MNSWMNLSVIFVSSLCLSLHFYVYTGTFVNTHPCTWMCAILCVYLCMFVCMCLCICMSACQVCNRWSLAGDNAGLHAQSALRERINQRDQPIHWGLRQPVCHHLLCQLLYALCLFGEYWWKGFLLFIKVLKVEITVLLIKKKEQSAGGKITQLACV